MSDFSFRDIPAYKLAKEFHHDIQQLLKENNMGRRITDQLERATLSVVLNIAEGYGRYHAKEKKYFYITARASVNESVACLDIMFGGDIPAMLLEKAVRVAKMLSGLVTYFKG